MQTFALNTGKLVFLALGWKFLIKLWCRNLGKREAAYRHVLGIRQQTLLQVHTILEVAKRMWQCIG